MHDRASKHGSSRTRHACALLRRAALWGLLALFAASLAVAQTTDDERLVEGLRQRRLFGLAEFYWGRENRSGNRRHALFYPSCEEKCRPILGFMLCGLEEARA